MMRKKSSRHYHSYRSHCYKSYRMSRLPASLNCTHRCNRHYHSCRVNCYRSYRMSHHPASLNYTHRCSRRYRSCSSHCCMHYRMSRRPASSNCTHRRNHHYRSCNFRYCNRYCNYRSQADYYRMCSMRCHRNCKRCSHSLYRKWYHLFARCCTLSCIHSRPRQSCMR